MQRFIATHLRRPLDKMKAMSMENILAAVRNDVLFGCVECDIHVPEQLRETFSQMCPIFKNTEISRENEEENDIMRQPRRSLIGSMVGKKILFTTPLLKWYLEHGLQVHIKYRFFSLRMSTYGIEIIFR